MFSINNSITKDENLLLLQQYQEATDHSVIVSKTDKYGIITYANNEFCKISEYSKDELIGQNHNIVRHPDNPKSLYKDLWNCISKEKKIWKGLLKNKTKSDGWYYVKTTIKPIVDSNNNIIEYIALRDDITDIMNPKRQLQDLLDSVDEAIVAIIKIDEFNDIENFYGKKLTQKIENSFAEKFLNSSNKDCIFKKVYILGDGEYAFAKNAKDCLNTTSNIETQLKEFQENINNGSINIGDIDYDISVIISLSYGENPLENAKYGIKELLKTNQSFIVAHNMLEKEQENAEKNIKTLTMIKKAIDDLQIISYFQPIINNKTQKIEKYESLIRIIDENGNIILPYLFLDISKKGKYYSQLTSLVLENSFKALNSTDMDISINISVLDIEKESTREKFFELIEKNKENASRVILELLEDEDVKDFKLIDSFITKVKSLGVRIAIDDFGAGYSNFERLITYQPDIIKIDGSLIKNIEHNKLSLSVVKTIVAFAKDQNIKIVAEYVENKNIFNILNNLGVDYSQGYYFGKPKALIDVI